MGKVSVGRRYAKELEAATKLREELKATEERAAALRRESEALKRKDEATRRDKYATALGRAISHLFYPQDPKEVKLRLEAIKEEGRL